MTSRKKFETIPIQASIEEEQLRRLRYVIRMGENETVWRVFEMRTKKRKQNKTLKNIDTRSEKFSWKKGLKVEGYNENSTRIKE